MRLLSGLLAAQNFDSTLTGDASLSKRPMNRVANPLREMGAVIETAAEGRPPMTIRGGHKLKGLTYTMPMASAQVKSCLLLAGLYAEGKTTVTEPAPTRDHTERMLRGFGYPVTVDGATASVESGGKLTATHIEVPGDISSSAFFLVAASIAEGSELVLEHVGINPTRTGVIDILRLMGADITLENQREVGGEPVADLRVRAAKLKGIEIPEALVPLAIDEFPVLFVAAACAEGRTVLTGAEELRVKESDRIQVMADGLLALGVKCQPTRTASSSMAARSVAAKCMVTAITVSPWPSAWPRCAPLRRSASMIAPMSRRRSRTSSRCARRSAFVWHKRLSREKHCTGHHHRWAKRFGQRHGRRDSGQAPWLEPAGFRCAVSPAGVRCAQPWCRPDQ